MTRRANKERHYAIISSRAEAAIEALYHNATPRLPQEDEPEASVWNFFDWLAQEAEFEIEYINSGGAYGRTFTQDTKCWAERHLKSERAQRKYRLWRLRQMEEDRAKGGAWERITDWGEVRQYGRGGRTLAPEGLVTARGQPFSSRLANARVFDLVESIRVIEAFNAYVKEWCEDVPQRWAEAEQEVWNYKPTDND